MKNKFSLYLCFLPVLFAVVLGNGCASSAPPEKQITASEPAANSALGTPLLPEDKSGVDAFLILLQQKQNTRAVDLYPEKGVEVIPSLDGPQALIKFNCMPDRAFLLYRLSLTNIGKDGFLVVYQNRGVNQANGIWGYFEIGPNGKLTKHELLWPIGTLASPFVVTRGDQTIFRFGKKLNQNWTITEYQWTGHEFLTL